MPQKADVTVLTATIPGREHLLDQCKKSVAAQTLPVTAHIIKTDVDHKGESWATNQMIPHVTTEWVLVLNDDDLLMPDYLERMWPHVDGYDIIYSNVRVTGEHWDDIVAPFDYDRIMQRGNYIPTTAIIRTDLARKIGWREDLNHCEDADFYVRAYKLEGAKFKYVPEQLWIYRFSADSNHVNKSRVP